MGVIETKVFKSGNSVAVRLPRELGIAAGVAVTIEKVGDKLEIRPIMDRGEEKRRLLTMLDGIAAIWAEAPEDADRGKRDRIDFPNRPGL